MIGPQKTKAREWGSEVSLEPGRPSVVGGIQTSSTATFLIVCAHIVD
ncbi:MAG: hypothetical protein JSU70_20325 [Phycisphaerales bacterium]|nr:MAG: hypothetical protein JSU70_20325 [Phycisphaerales bacterium]